VPRSNFGQKVILWAFCCQSSNFAALVRPLRARARAGDRPGHTILAEYLCPTEPGSAETAPVLRGRPQKNHCTESSKLQATTRPFCLSQPFLVFSGEIGPHGQCGPSLAKGGAVSTGVRPRHG
jgi:hypothetical protein